MISKRGISPLIATVLLVGLTIVLAGIVSTFIIKQTKETFNPENLIEDSSMCDQMQLGVSVDNTIDLDAPSITSGTSVSYLDGVYIQNKGSYAVRGLILKVGGMSDIKYNFDTRISSSGNQVSDVTLNTGLKCETGNAQCYIEPSKSYIFNANSGKGIPISKDLTNKKIEVYPIIWDYEKEQAVNCVKSALVFDYGDICKGYGKTDKCEVPSASP